MRVEPVFDEPALLLKGRKRILVIADLHIGLVTFHDHEIVKRVNDVVEKTRADEVLILGDLKHDICKTDRVKILFENLDVEFTLVKGNHDGNLKGEKSLKIGKIGLFHGHSIPDENVLSSDVLVFAHAHPSVLISGVKERVWLLGEWNDSKLIVLPAFNDLCASTPVNLNKPAGFMFRRWDYLNGDVLTLDGVFLGRLKGLKPHLEKRSNGLEV